MPNYSFTKHSTSQENGLDALLWLSHVLPPVCPFVVILCYSFSILRGGSAKAVSKPFSGRYRSLWWCSGREKWCTVYVTGVRR